MTERNELITQLSELTEQLAFYEALIEEKIKPHRELIDAVKAEYGENVELLKDAIDTARENVHQAMVLAGDKRAEWAGLECLIRNTPQTIVDDMHALKLHLEVMGVLDQYITLDIPRIKRELGKDLPGMTTRPNPVLAVKKVGDK